MSLNADQREGTRAELQRNLELSELTVEAIAVEMGISSSRVTAALQVSKDGDPGDVWLLRDLLERTVRANGGTPERYSVLTESERGNAERWFGLSRRLLGRR
jgi:hypothetical protein